MARHGARGLRDRREGAAGDRGPQRRHVPAGMVGRLAPRFTPRAVKELVAGGVWAQVRGGYRSIDSIEDQRGSPGIYDAVNGSLARVPDRQVIGWKHRG